MSIATSAVCAGIGAAALLSSYSVSARRASHNTKSTCASARVVGAPKNDVYDTPTKKNGGTFLDDGFLIDPDVAKEMDKQFGSSTVSLNQNSQKVKDAKRELAVTQVETRQSKNLGQSNINTILTHGNGVVKTPTVTGGCIFNMTESYADALIANSGE